MSSTSDIKAKWQELKDRGLDLGPQAGVEQSAGSGGRVQIYQNGRIYWHGDIGAFEVHGRILTKYLEMGGPGTNPASGKRSLGYPKSDELRTRDGPYVSHFEWGSIYWVRDVGAVSFYGDFFIQWKLASNVGYPLTEPMATPGGGRAVFFQRGCLFQGGPGNSSFACYLFPARAVGMLGKPGVMTVDNISMSCLRLRVWKSVWEPFSATGPRC